jgi:hypothetical protein
MRSKLGSIIKLTGNIGINLEFITDEIAFQLYNEIFSLRAEWLSELVENVPPLLNESKEGASFTGRKLKSRKRPNIPGFKNFSCTSSSP